MSENTNETNVSGELTPEVELQMEVEAEPSIEMTMEVEADPTIEMEMQVEIGSRASELNAEAWAVGQRGGVDVSSTDQTYHNNAKYYAEQAQAIVAGDIVDDDAGIGDLLKVWSADKDVKELDKKAPVIEGSLETEASLQEIQGAADGMPMKVVVGIEPVQAGSGDPSPENVRPITGWTGCKITRTGKNFVDVSLADWKIGYLINASGNEQSNNSYKYTQYYFRVKGAGIVTFSYTSDGRRDTYFTLIEYDANKNFIARKTTGATVAEGYNKATVTLDEGTAFVRFNAPKTATITNMMLEYAPDATTFEPFGTIFDITFPSEAGTVYGGELTVNKDGSGELVVDRAGFALDELEFSYANSRWGTAAISGIATPANNNQVLKGLMCSAFTAKTANQVSSVVGSIAVSNNAKILLNVNGTSDTTAFENAVDGQIIVIPLATAVSYSLTPGQVKSLLGYNAMWADTGNIKSVEYCADTKLYIDSFNPTPSMIATNNIASGKYFMVGNQLYIATEAIAQGATITPGTNCTAISLADALNTITE